MKLYLKFNSIGLFRALDDLLPQARSEIADALRGLKDAPNQVDYQTNLEAGETLTRLSETLFYRAGALRTLATGIYFGSDTCEHLLPYPRHIDEVMAHCEKHKLHFVLVLPPLSDKYLGHAANALDMLATRDAEVVVNDYGALHLASCRPGLTVTLGRLFNKVQRNAFIDRLDPDDATLERKRPTAPSIQPPPIQGLATLATAAAHQSGYSAKPAASPGSRATRRRGRGR